MQLCSELAGVRPLCGSGPYLMSILRSDPHPSSWLSQSRFGWTLDRFCLVVWAAQLYCFVAFTLCTWKTGCVHCTVWMSPSLWTSSPEFCRIFMCAKAMLKTACLDLQTYVVLALVSTSWMLPFRQNLKYLRKASWVIYISYMLHRITDFKEVVLHVCNR